MKKIVNISIFALLLLVFGSFMFTFQVRQDEVAFLSTSGGTPQEHNGPAFKFRWPWPFQDLYKFDKRVHVAETDYEEMPTADKSSLVVQFYFGWKIEDKGASRFFQSFQGNKGADAEERMKYAQSVLQKMVQDAGKAEVQKLASSTQMAMASDENSTKGQWAAMEVQVAKEVQAQLTAQNLGVTVQFVGVRRVGVPQKNLDTVLDAMVKEWESEAEKVKKKADEDAQEIISIAESARKQAIAEAKQAADKAEEEQSQEAAQSIAQLAKNKDLALFLLQIESIKKSVRSESTLILDETMGPFPFLKGVKPEIKPEANNGE